MMTSSPGVEQRLNQVEETLFTATGDEDLLWPVFQAVIAPEFRYNRPLEISGSINGRITCESGMDSLDGRGPDVFGCIEIRFTGPEPDDVLASRPQLGNACRHGKGRGGFDALYPVCKPDLVQNCYPVF